MPLRSHDSQAHAATQTAGFRMSHIAGTASSLAGFYSTVAGAIAGTVIGRSFDGTVRPLLIGITVLCAATFATVLFTEKFRLISHKAAPEVKVPCQ